MLNRTLIATTLLLAGSQAARAEHRDFAPVSGDWLAIDQSCARSVSVAVDPSLSGRILVAADAAHAEEIDQLRAETENNAARVGLMRGRHRCWTADGSSGPTLTLSVRVPARFDIAVSDSGQVDYALGETGALTLSLSGQLAVSARRVDGDVTADISGTGTVKLEQVDADKLDARLSGKGVFAVDSGRINALTVDESGATRVTIAPTVDTATLNSSGIGNITVGGVRGSLTRASSGLGRIEVGGRPSDNSRENRDEDRDNN